MKKALKNISIKSSQARRIMMRKTIIPLIALASMFVVAAVPNAQARQCSNGSLKGAYGFFDVHTVLPAGTPLSAIGRWNFDGKGNFTNTVILNDNGTVPPAPLNDSGTYIVNSDCTGQISILGGTGTLEIVIVDGGNEFYASNTKPSSIVTTFSVAKKQFPDDDDDKRR